MTDLPSPSLPDRMPRRVRHELRFRRLEVRAVERVTPHLVRITLGGDPLEGFTSPGFDDHAKELLQQLSELGARQSAVWYALAQIAIEESRPTEAREDFKAAWRIEPMPRDEIFDRPLLAALLQDYQIRELIHLSEAEEQSVLLDAIAEGALHGYMHAERARPPVDGARVMREGVVPPAMVLEEWRKAKK